MYKSAAENAIAISAINDGLEDGTYIIDDKGNLKYKDKEIKVDIKNYNFESGILVIEQGQIKDIKLIKSDKITTGKELSKIDKWDGKTIKEVTPDSNGIYHITKVSELAWIAQQVNSDSKYQEIKISLDASLNLNNKEWTPIGTKKSDNETIPFKGTFDGNNNIISGIYINKQLDESLENQNLGLFGYVDTATINNLTIKDSYIKGYSNIGVGCGRVVNGGNINNVVVENIYVNAIQVSGIVVGATHTNVSLSNLYSYNSEIYGNGLYISGVVGALQIASSLNNAYSNSIVSNISDGKLAGTGGILGSISSESVGNNLVSEAVVSGYSGLGGIVGQFQKDSTLTNSISYATISGTNIIGGVIGMNSGLPNGSILDNVKSYAVIKSNGEYIGGVIGKLSQGNNYLTNIYSKSNVKGKDKVGGIIGGFLINDATTLNYKNVISESTIEGETNKGELWGYTDSTSVINPLD